jgi:hypothetical protein
LEYIRRTGGSVSVGDHVWHEELEPPPEGHDGSPLRLGTIFKIRTSLGQVLEFVEDDTGALCCRVNSYISKDNAPSTINFGGLSIIPLDAMTVQTSMLCLVPFNPIQSVSKVEHHSKFTDAHYGYFRVYSV